MSLEWLATYLTCTDAELAAEICTHVAAPAARRAHSPLDRLGAGPLDRLETRAGKV